MLICVYIYQVHYQSKSHTRLITSEIRVCNAHEYDSLWYLDQILTTLLTRHLCFLPPSSLVSHSAKIKCCSDCTISLCRACRSFTKDAVLAYAVRFGSWTFSPRSESAACWWYWGVCCSGDRRDVYFAPALLALANFLYHRFAVYLALSAIPTYYLVLPCVFPLMIAFVGSSSMHCQASHSTGYCQSSANPDGQQTVFVFVYFILQTWIVLCFISKRN